MPLVNLLVEGDLDEAVGNRLLALYGGKRGSTFGKQGVGYIEQKINGFAQTSAGMPLLVLVDLMDTGLSCAPDVLRQWLPHPGTALLFRVVVEEIESWILADRAGIAAHLGVRLNHVPTHSDSIKDPKRKLIELASNSRWNAIREGICPPFPGASTGPRYNSILLEFVRDKWDPAVASTVSPSLARASNAISDFVSSL